MLTEATSPQAGTASLEDLTRRRQRPCPPRGKRNFHPTVRTVLADGEPAYEVGLSGGLGSQETMLIDREDWQWASTSVTPVWVVNRNGDGQSYVCSGSRAAGLAAGDSRKKPCVRLHTLIADRYWSVGSADGAVFINGDRRDLRRVNLKILPKGEIRRHIAAGPRAVVERDPADADPEAENKREEVH